MNQLTQFQFNTKDIRVIERDGQPWFLASDVCKALEIANGRDTVRDFPDEEKDAVGIADTIGRTQQMTVISESGLYRLIFQSRKKESEKFKTWVVNEVLPQIRKTGSYQKPKSLEEMSLEVITGLSARIQEQKLVIEDMTPKAEFYDALTNSERCTKVGDTAKILNLTEGQNLFFKRLRADGVLMESNMPYQSQLDQGHFKVVHRKVRDKFFPQTLVTGKGMIWLQKKYKHLQKAPL